MAQGRVQTPELRGNDALRPAPIKSDTYAAPAQPPRDNRMAALAQALAGFSSSLGNLAPTMKPSNEDKQKSIWLAEKKMHGMTNEEVKAAVGAGSLPAYADPWAQQASNAVAGAKSGVDFATSLKDQMAREFDWDTGNPDEYITAQINGYLENNPYKNDPNFGTNFIRSADGLREWATKFGVDRKNERFVEMQGQAAFDFLDTSFKQGAEGGTEPTKLADMLFSQTELLGQKGTLGVTDETIEQEMLNIARRYAGTRPEHALAIINKTRKGRDGTERSFANDRDKQDEVLQIKATAAKAIDEQWEQRQRQALADKNYELFRARGAEGISEVSFKTPAGRDIKITAEDQLKAAEAEFLKASEVIATGRRETGDERLFRELNVFRGQGRKHPAMETALSNLADMASPELLGDPEGKAKIMEKLGLYRKMQQESKNSILAYTKEADRDFAEAFIQGTDYLGMSDDAALDFAISTTQPLDAAGQEQVSRYRQEIDSQVGNLATKKGWFGLDSDSDPTNYSTVRTKVSQLAQKFVVAGVKPDAAVEAASKAVKENMVVHNGTMLDLNGLDVPDQFPDAVDEALVQFMAANPKVVERSGLDPEDLTIVPLGGTISGGRFKIVDKSNVAIPLYNDRQEVAVITLADIRKMWQQKGQKEEAYNLRQDNFNNSVQQKGLVRAVDVDGSVNWINPKTKEVMDFQYTEKDDVPLWKKTGKRYKRATVVTEAGSFVLDPRNLKFTLSGSALKKHREEMKKLADDHDAAAAERRKFWGSILPSIKIGDTVLND